jgi:hypothetical protein
MHGTKVKISLYCRVLGAFTVMRHFEKCNNVILLHLMHFVCINCNQQGRWRTANQHSMTPPNPWPKAISYSKLIHTWVKRMSVDKVDVFPNFNVHGSVHRNNIVIYIQQDATLHSLFFCKLLYMFRILPPRIIRSENNYIYSARYLSHRYCYLLLSWKSWNWFECAYATHSTLKSVSTPPRQRYDK